MFRDGELAGDRGATGSAGAGGSASGSGSASSSGSLAKSSRSVSSSDGVRSAAAGCRSGNTRTPAAAELVHLGDPAAAGDPGRVAGDLLRREVAERRDHPRLDQLDLALEIGPAGLDLLRLRIAVAGRSATSGCSR